MSNENDLAGSSSAASPGKMRGARPSPRHKLAAAVPFQPVAAPPSQFAYVPPKLNVWGNDRYGDCVTAEEAFAKACNTPEIFIPEDVVIRWAQRHGFLNGADLAEVMDAMRSDGFQIAPNTYDDGPYLSVDFSNETVLQAAIAQGPVKIGIDANALPGGAGSQQGWYSTSGGHYRNEDHCVALCGYGPALWLYQQLGVMMPASLNATQPGYLLFTWGTIGFVSHDWIMGTCGEAWVRNPTTVVVGPTPTPPPPPPPIPPTPTPGSVAQVVVTAPLLPGTYPIGAAMMGQPLDAKAVPWALLLQILIAILNGLVPIVPPTPTPIPPVPLPPPQYLSLS